MTDLPNSSPADQILSRIRDEDLLSGFHDDFASVEGVVIYVKGRALNGETLWSLRRSKTISPEEYLGFLMTQVDRARRLLLDEWLDDDD